MVAKNSGEPIFVIESVSIRSFKSKHPSDQHDRHPDRYRKNFKSVLPPTGRALAHVYFEDAPGRRSAARVYSAPI